MKSGSSQAVLVAELIAVDGPHVLLADAFVTERCSLCGGDHDDLRFHDGEFACQACVAAVTRPGEDPRRRDGSAAG